MNDILQPLDGEFHEVQTDMDGTKRYYLNGQYHREDGPAIEYANGEKRWYIRGQLHRVDGPAVEYADGQKHWYIQGQCHREGGPAVEYSNGDKHWYIRGQKLNCSSQREFEQLMRMKGFW